MLQEIDVKYFKQRYANQDPLENFFGCIHSLNFRYTNPMGKHFESSFKTLLINNLTARSTSGNCELICNDERFPNLFPILNKDVSINVVNKILRHKSIESCIQCTTILLQNNGIRAYFNKTCNVLLQHLQK